MVGGRVTRRQASKRPDDIWPEIWNTMSRQQRERALENWENKKVAIDEARKNRTQDAAGDRVQSDSEDEVSVASVASTFHVPSMPVFTGSDTLQGHREKLE